MKKIVVILLACFLLLNSCSGVDRWAKDVKSDISRGLYRHIEVADLKGNIVWEFEGEAYISKDSSPGNLSVMIYEGDEIKKVDFIGLYSLKSVEI